MNIEKKRKKKSQGGRQDRHETDMQMDVLLVET